MLFMKIVTKPIENREAVRQKRTQGRANFPGVKILGEWSTIQNDRVFVLIDVTDPRDLALMLARYSNLVNDEIFPVMETEELLELLSSGKN